MDDFFSSLEYFMNVLPKYDLSGNRSKYSSEHIMQIFHLIDFIILKNAHCSVLEIRC